MKQLIARIDERLHAGLKARAEDEGRTLNAVVTEALEATVEGHGDPLAAVRSRAAKRGVPLARANGPPPDPAARAELIEELRGTGPVIDELLEEDRGRRD